MRGRVRVAVAGASVPSSTTTKLEFTQFVGVGFGSTGSLNGDLLTLLAERQGGIYLQNPDSPTDDLKEFFVKAFGMVSDEIVLIDPRGVLGATQAASDPVEYSSCGDGKLTFTTGWRQGVAPGELRLLVTTPAGDLVRSGDPEVEASTEALYSFFRVRLPYRGQSGGPWRSQLIRPNQFFVNGFTPDSFVDTEGGVALVRREIQRLCPDGCRRVLSFERGRRGNHSAYDLALERETASRLLGQVRRVNGDTQLANALTQERWDLLVYALMEPEEKNRPFDEPLLRLLCESQRAILTDVRGEFLKRVLKCAGATLDQTQNWKLVDGGGGLADETLWLGNPGHPVFSQGFRLNPAVQATASGGRTGAVLARAVRGEEQNYYIDVLGKGLSRLSPAVRKRRWRTGEELVAMVRVLPSYVPAGGYDHVDARVEVEYPTTGLGTLIAERREAPERSVAGEVLDRRAAALAGISVPTSVATYQLYDDGTHGDLEAGNYYWSAALPGMGKLDGTYEFHFVADFTKAGCTTRRELTQSVFVDVAVDAQASKVRISPAEPDDSASGRLNVHLTPADGFGNLLGPGRAGTLACQPSDVCRVDPQSVKDHNDGSYSFVLVTTPGSAGVRVEGFDTLLDLTLPCHDCPRLSALELATLRVSEHAQTEGKIGLSAPARERGHVVHLASSHPELAQVPKSVRVPLGQSTVSFPIRVLHAHDGEAVAIISATYGGQTLSRTLTVEPLPVSPPKVPEKNFRPGHYGAHQQPPG